MCKILAICPYVGLRDLFLEVKEELQLDVDVYVGDLYDGLALASSLEHRGYDVMISRGATAKLLKKHVSTPVVEIPVTGYDILRTLTLLNGFSGKIGMMTYLNNIPGAHAIGKLLHMDITFYPIREEAEIEKEIRRAASEGVQVIVGDVISTRMAAKFGMQAILITSGKEAIVETLAADTEWMSYVKREKTRVQRLVESFSADEGVLLFEKETCTFMNERAKRLLQEEDVPLSWNKLIAVVPELSRLHSAFKEVTFTFRGHPFRARFVPLVEERFLLLLKEETKSADQHDDERAALFHFNSLVARSEQMKKVIAAAKKVSRSHLPIVIYGEEGVGKECIAQAIHNDSERQSNRYVSIDVEKFTDLQLETKLLQSFAKARGGTLYIASIHALPLALQSVLLETWQNERSVRIIASSSKPLERLVTKKRFRRDLFEALHQYTLKVPPLRERKEDIEDFIRLFIASANALTKKQISGIDRAVLQVMNELSWRGNIDELKSVVEQMCILSPGPFIEYDDVKELLDRIEERERSEKTNLLNIHGKTLEEIEEEVIMAVLKQVGFNQTKAAEQLGINRTTLWRKVKQIENR